MGAVYHGVNSSLGTEVAVNAVDIRPRQTAETW